MNAIRLVCLTPAKTYTNTFLADANYTSRNIRNRLVTSTLTDGTNTVTLVSNSYDDYRTRTDCTTDGSNFYGELSNFRSTPGQWDTSFSFGVVYRGNVVKQVVPGGWTCLAYKTTGALIYTSDSTGKQSAASFSSLTNYAAPDSLTSNGLSTTMSWNSWLGLAQETGANTESTALQYDLLHRPTQVDDWSGTSLITYTDATSSARQTITKTAVGYTKQTLDGFGRVVKEETGATTVSSVVDTVYDACACTPIGKLKKVSRPYAPGATVYWTTYSYDGLGRTTQVVAADGASTTTYLYQGNTVTVTDPATRWKKMTMDAFGRIVQVNEPNPATGADYVTTYTYDVMDHLVRADLPRPTPGGTYTQSRTWTYNASDQRLASQTLPETGTTSFAYNTLGLLKSKTDAKGIRKELTYDTQQRVTAVRYYKTSDNSEQYGNRVDSYYDTNPFDATFTQYGAGRLTAVSYQIQHLIDTYGTYRTATVKEMYSYTRTGG